MYMPGTVQVSYKTDYQDTPMGAVTEQILVHITLQLE